MIRSALTFAVLLFALTAFGHEYDAERDIGLKAEDATPAVAAINTTRLTLALEAQWSGGRFRFADGHVGAVLDPIAGSGKEFFFAGTIRTSNKIGCAFHGAGCRSYVLPSAGYNGGAGGLVTRFTKIDPIGSFLRVRCSCLDTYGIEWRGQPYNFDPTGEGPQGSKTPICFEIEGRAGAPTTCKHAIGNCTFAFFQQAICCRGGYYDSSNTFVPCEEHADLGSVHGSTFVSDDVIFRSENQQCVGWSFWVNEVTTIGYQPTVVFDIVRGGDVNSCQLMLDHPAVTLFKVNHFSPNSARLVCDGLKWDRGTNTANDAAGNPCYLSLFEYAGPQPCQPWMKWAVRVTGNASNSDPLNPLYHAERLLMVPSGFDTSDFRFDVTRLPKIAGVN